MKDAGEALKMLTAHEVLLESILFFNDWVNLYGLGAFDSGRFSSSSQNAPDGKWKFDKKQLIYRFWEHIFSIRYNSHSNKNFADFSLYGLYMIFVIFSFFLYIFFHSFQQYILIIRLSVFIHQVVSCHVVSWYYCSIYRVYMNVFVYMSVCLVSVLMVAMQWQAN